MTCDGGRWLRRQALVLSQNNHTPVWYWLSCTLPDLSKWIQESNRLVAEAKANRPRQRPPSGKKRRGR